jgi:hypothetical protein
VQLYPSANKCTFNFIPSQKEKVSLLVSPPIFMEVMTMILASDNLSIMGVALETHLILIDLITHFGKS